MRATVRFLLMLVGAVAVAALASGGADTVAAAATDRTVRTITGTATGTATGVPDTATISLGADSRAGSATEALAKNADRVDGVTRAMLFVGVKQEDIQTSNVSVFPTFDDHGRITGYSVSTRMTAKTHDVPNAGKVIDAAAKLGGDDLRVDTITLSIEDTGPVVRAARRRAVESAHDQASQLARAAKIGLGRVRTIVEEQSPASSPLARVSAADLSQQRSAIPISAGTQDLTINVKVVYDIR